MATQNWFRVLRTRWLVIVLATLAGTAAAITYSLLTPPIYQSTTRFFVSTSAQTVDELYQGNLASQQRVASYTDLLTSEELANRVLTEGGFPLTLDELLGEISAESKPNTVLITATVSDRSAARARDIASVLGGQFVDFVREVETPAAGGSSAAEVSVVQQPQIASEPASPKVVRNVVLGTVLGLLVGLAAAVVRQRWDRTLTERSSFEELSDSVVVGRIPMDKVLGRSHVVFREESSSPVAEAFRELRTNLQFLSVDNPPRLIVLTSSVPGEGKSVTSINLAAVLAENGSTVALVEGDLRRPRVSKYLGLVSEAGLSNVLSRQASTEEVMQPTKFRGLSVLASGPIPPNPSELLGSDLARKTLAELRGAFDYVIVDAPPLLPVTDAAVLTAHCDGALLVTRHGVVKKEELERAVSNLELVSAPLMGLVITMAPATGSEAYHYSYDYRPDAPAAPTS
ncbi:MAG: polysaccharide biosynthesis tyrosine autokinase [Rhodococcus sp. (in: high G+C Gram-positive bacteria)]